MTETQVEAAEAARRHPDDVGFFDPKVVEDCDRVVTRRLLRVDARIGRDVGRREAARVEGDAAVAPAEFSDLRLPPSMIVCELVDKEDRRSGARLLEVKADAVGSGREG